MEKKRRREELIRKVERRMKKQNRRTVVITLVAALICGLVIGWAVGAMQIIPVVLPNPLRADKPAGGQPAAEPTQDALALPEATEAVPTPAPTPKPTPEPAYTANAQLNQAVTVAGLCEFSLTRFDFDRQVKPSNTEGPYWMQQVQSEGSVYLYADGQVKNLKEGLLNSHAAFDVRVCAGDQEYEGFAAYEIDDGANLSNYADLKAGESCRLVVLAELPEAVRDSAEPLFLLLTVDGQESIYRLR